MSNYLKVMSRKRTWTPVAVDKGEIKAGAEDALFRALALRTLELPVKEMLKEGLEKDLPADPGVIPALQSNMSDEDKHDQALNYIVEAHGTVEKYEREAERIRKVWLDAPEHGTGEPVDHSLYVPDLSNITALRADMHEEVRVQASLT